MGTSYKIQLLNPLNSLQNGSYKVLCSGLDPSPFCSGYFDEDQNLTILTYLLSPLSPRWLSHIENPVQWFPTRMDKIYLIWKISGFWAVFLHMNVIVPLLAFLHFVHVEAKSMSVFSSAIGANTRKKNVNARPSRNKCAFSNASEHKKSELA